MHVRKFEELSMLATQLIGIFINKIILANMI